MSDKEKAFAYATGNPEQGGDVQEGMDLRDWFAGMALQGLVTRYYDTKGSVIDVGEGILGAKFVTKGAYEIADAMMEARDV